MLRLLRAGALRAEAVQKQRFRTGPQMIPPPRFSRTTATMMTMPLSTSPAFARPRFSREVRAMAIAAISAPIAANGIRNQLPQPSSGTSASSIHSIANMPQSRLINPIVFPVQSEGRWRRALFDSCSSRVPARASGMEPVDLDLQFAPADRRMQQDPRHCRAELRIERCSDPRQLFAVADVDLQARAAAE